MWHRLSPAVHHHPELLERGRHDEVVAALVDLAPGAIVYVACDVAALARDIERVLQRTLGDAVVTRTPTPEELARLERALPTTHVDLRAVAGDRLRCAATPLDEGHDLAWVSIGGFDASELLEDYELCKPMLHFGFSEPGTRWH